MNIKDWLNSDVVDENTKNELLTLSEDEISERFNGLLEFGTGGLRGLMGAGTHRMNIYTVRHASQAVADLIKSKNIKNPSIVVDNDSRNNSREFALESAKVFVANGIKVYLFDELRPTPVLSFSVPVLGCTAGINITASHNPKEYNGYKVYWSDGAQLSPDQADGVFAFMKSTDMLNGVKIVSEEEAMKNITVLGKDFDEKYISSVLEQLTDPEIIKKNHDMGIIYTPFHGAGYRLVPEVLKRAGFTNVITVAEQGTPDGNFPTVKSPNPENPEGFKIAVELAKKNNADLIIGTDPDCDRMGIVVNANGEYKVISGNRTGVILLDYIIRSLKEKNKLPANACAVKTIVTTELATKICKENGVSIVNVLTGFKFIGEKMTQFRESGEYSFIFGFEESYGYLAGDYARDKDGVFASMIIAEAAAYYASKNMTLWDALQELFKKYGYSSELLVNIEMKGLDGAEKMKAITNRLRTEPPKEIGGVKVVEFKDYKPGIEGLPPSDVLYFVLEDGSILVIRPSGTEPKIKLYTLVSGRSIDEADNKAKSLSEAFVEQATK